MSDKRRRKKKLKRKKKNEKGKRKKEGGNQKEKQRGKMGEKECLESNTVTLNCQAIALLQLVEIGEGYSLLVENYCHVHKRVRGTTPFSDDKHTCKHIILYILE